MGLVTTMMESVATLKRPTVGRDTAQGVTSDPFRTLWADYPCCLSQAGPRIQELYAQRNTLVTTTVWFAVDPYAEVNDILQVTDRTGITSTYLVKGEAQAATGRGRLWSVDCELIRAP